MIMTMLKGKTANLFKPRTNVSAADRAMMQDVFLVGDGAESAPTPPDRLTLAQTIQFYLMSAAFEHWTVSAVISRHRPGLHRPVSAATLKWAARRLPLSASTIDTLKGSNVSHGDLLALMFSDMAFLEAVYAPRVYGWSAGDFLPPVDGAEEIEGFVDRLLTSQSPLIDSAWLSTWGLNRVVDAEMLVRFGQYPTFRANALFDASWYAARHHTGVSNYFANLQHYVEQGERFGYSPNPFLNTRRYAEIFPDLFAEIRSGALPCFLQHLIARDAVEGRSSASHFDAHFYNGQVSRPRSQPYGSAWGHYVNEGWHEGLQPNPAFDQLWYLRTYPDALKAVEDGLYPNAFSHYVLEGETAGLRPSAFFDPVAYTRANKDIAEVKTTTPFRHFWQQGRLEARDFGDPVTKAVAGYFQKRLPDSADVVGAKGLARLASSPAEVLEHARTPDQARPVDLVALLKGQAPMTPAGQAALAGALQHLGRPVVNVEVGKQQQIHIGDTARMYVSGLAAFAHLPLRDVRANGDAVQGECEFFRYFRLEGVESVVVLGGDLEDLKSGFMAWFEFSAENLPAETQRVDLELIFGRPGEAFTLVAHATIDVAVHKRPQVSTSEAAVQVAMASFNPPPKPFRDQVDSILADPSVHLLISDDASPPMGAQSLAQYAGNSRVDIDINTQNGGFISNFERSLYMRSPAAKMILFADQDDIWRPEKIGALTAQLKPGVACVFSDMRIVTGQGDVISPTFWTGRRVHHHDALTLGVANTVTGAAAVFPAPLAEIMTPFPRYMGVYHDQWLSVLSAAVGEVAYVSTPLYDYVQHGTNVLGFSGSRSGAEARWAFIARRLRKALRRGWADECDLAYVEVALAETIPLLQRFVLLNEALLRVPHWSNSEVRRLGVVLLSAIRGEAYDPVYLRRAWGRLARRVGGAEGLLNIDDQFAAILMARAMVSRGVATARAFTDVRFGAYVHNRENERRINNPDSSFFESKIAPITLAEPRVSKQGGLRINMFLPELQLGTFFGGYHSKISLISRLQERGIRTRLVLVDQPSVDHDNVARIIGAFPELERGLGSTEIVAMGGRDEALDLGPQDALLATTWWSAYIVDDLRKKLSRERFLYFIQEFEPFTFPLGTWYRAAEATYDFPHDAVFSTEILRDYFASINAGIFGPEAVADARSLPFRNPITGLKGMPRTPVAERKRRLLFYARPQAHAARNMYDFGLSALRLAVQRLGDELEGWDLVGVGASESALVKLTSDHSLRLISKLDSFGYRQMLASSDVGLALMYTPHPSLVPLEMAAAGMVTVTNACMSKTQDSFAGVSDLIHVAEPEVEAIAEALVTAFRQVNAGAICNPGLDWPVSPAGAFPDVWLDKFVAAAKHCLNENGCHSDV